MFTNARCTIVLTALTILGVTKAASAQEVTRMPDGARHAVGLDTGLEGAFIARATYAHRLDLGILEDTRLFARFTMPFVSPDLGDLAFDGGARATLVSWRNFRVALLFGPVLKRSENELFTATAVGVGATTLIGYEGPRWGLSAEAGYEQLLATHLRHSDLYKNTFYAGAKDGWYALSGSTAQAGLRGGVRFGAVEINARAGLETTGQLRPITPPFYGTLGVAYSF